MRPLFMAEQPLHTAWTLWAHLPHDTDWGINSYNKIHTIRTLGDARTLISSLPETLVRNCMLFLMREGVCPTWEDKCNRNGGSFSFKIANRAAPSAWEHLGFQLMGRTLSKDNAFLDDLTGITISPKKNFCILKIWTSSCSHQASSALDTPEMLPTDGCLFKRHAPAR